MNQARKFGALFQSQELKHLNVKLFLKFYVNLATITESTGKMKR